MTRERGLHGSNAPQSTTRAAAGQGLTVARFTRRELTAGGRSGFADPLHHGKTDRRQDQENEQLLHENPPVMYGWQMLRVLVDADNGRVRT